MMEQGTVNEERFLNFPIRYFLGCSFENEGQEVKRFKEVLSKIIGFGVATLMDSGRLKESQALDFLQLTTENMNDRNKHLYEAGKRDFATFKSDGVKIVYSNIKVSLVSRLWQSEMTHSEIMCFCAYCAVRSWIGQKPYKFMKGNDILLSRIFGFEKVEEYRKKLEKLPKYKQKFTTRYQLNKIKLELELHFGVSLYGIHCRGFYLSTKLDIYTLGGIAEEQRKSNKAKALKDAKLNIYKDNKK